MKKTIFLYIILFASLLIIIFSCSDRKEIFEITTHPDGWLEAVSSNYHGKAVIESGPDNCQSCHGKDYRGGSSDISCFKCHEVYPHTPNWKEKTAHGASMVSKLYELDDCTECHGEDYTGGSSKISCFQCHTQYPHPTDWLNSGSENSHGKSIVEDEDNIQNCVSCHGNDYAGGSSNVSCFTCHNSYPHGADWKKSDSHGLSIVNNVFSLEDCKGCHGSDYSGGSSNISCYTCHNQFPHLSGFLNEESQNFHGEIFSESSEIQKQCQKCHGEDYKGGISKVSCFTCHSSFPHPEDFLDLNSDSFHGKYISEKIHWNITICQECHGTDYSGESENSKNCRRCHSQPDGPETCNLCHGSTVNFAPPKALDGGIETTEIAVGAHQSHLINSNLSTGYEKNCNLCHIEPQQFDDQGHIDATEHSEIIFHSIATGNGKTNSTWLHDPATCTNIYCHGGFIFKKDESANPWGYAYGETEIKGNNPTLNWIQVDSGQAECGTCHNLPPIGHIGPTSPSESFKCSLCHGNVVDDNLNIIDKSLHINGSVDLQVPANSGGLDQILYQLKIKR